MLSDEGITSSLKPLPRESIFPGVACCSVFVEDGMFYRAQVIEVRGSKVEVQFVDYGNSTTVTTNDLFELPSTLLSASAQAIQCCLEGVRPLKKDWTVESCEVFSNWALNIELDAQFCGRADARSVYSGPALSGDRIDHFGDVGVQWLLPVFRANIHLGGAA